MVTATEYLPGMTSGPFAPPARPRPPPPRPPPPPGPRPPRHAVGGERLEGTGVVENPDAATIRRRDERVVARVEHHDARRYGRQVCVERLPHSAAIVREAHSAPVRHREHAGVARMLGDSTDQRLRQAGDDLPPCLAVVVAHVDVWMIVVEKVTIERRVDAAGDMLPRQRC